MISIVELNPSACYAAVLERDASADGQFFTAVRTTGIYCRPVCPARPPRFENVTFFPSALAAQAAGFRACRRCRPDAPPGSPAWSGSQALAARALRLIEDGALDQGDVEQLALRLGLGGRQLRRLFARHVGQPPLQVALAVRLRRARRLLESTRRPVPEVARASGFSSLRRFHDACRRAWGERPERVRARAARERQKETLR